MVDLRQGRKNPGAVLVEGHPVLRGLLVEVDLPVHVPHGALRHGQMVEQAAAELVGLHNQLLAGGPVMDLY